MLNHIHFNDVKEEINALKLGVPHSEPAQGISELSGCLGPPRPPEGPKSSLNEMTVYFIFYYYFNW